MEKLLNERYELKTGKYGFYFYDSTYSNDMSLKILLNRLNHYEKNMIIKCEIIRNDNKQILKLKTELRRLKNKYE